MPPLQRQHTLPGCSKGCRGVRPMPVALQARGVSRSFRGFRALDRVDLSVQEGETHAILGPNGAGKTTLFNCLSGFLQPTEGTVELFGETIAGLPPHKIVDRGLSRSFQISSVFETLTVLENLVVALQARTGHPVRFWEPREALLDEPTSGMGREDVERTVELAREVARSRTVVFVEHNMGVVAKLANRITVLARGQVLAAGNYEQIRNDPRVIEAYLGA